MAFNATVLRVLIASPSDVANERDKVEEAIIEWNRIHSEELKIVLLPGRWENDITPTYHGDDPQQIINEQLVNKCDILIGVFWTKLGTPTLNYTSGTLEEINIFIESKKEVMLYFVDKDIPRSADFRQVEQVDEFKSKYQNMGIYASFDERKIINHLYAKVNSIKKQYLDMKNELNDLQSTINEKNPYLSLSSLEVKDNIGDVFRKGESHDQYNISVNNPFSQNPLIKEVSSSSPATFVQILKKEFGLDWLEGAVKRKPERLNFMMGFPYQFNPSPKPGDQFLVCINDGSNITSYLTAEVESHSSNRIVKEIVLEDREGKVDFGFSSEVGFREYLNRYKGNKNIFCITLKNIDYSTKEIPEDQLQLIKYGLHILNENKTEEIPKLGKAKLRYSDAFGDVF
ncbi:hypothetical protein [Paenibacillus sp. NPDC058177]|uniref:hypothetical protein n=1 Tax=Paenibacillus sp. NPDC058177 TaxID=3346369 RepID=UPI0036DCC388